LSEDNVFVLDRPAFRIGTGPWHRPTEILRVDNAVRAALGVPPRGGRMVQPWARERKAQARSVEVVLRYVFKAAEVPSGELVMAIERPETFSLRVNGTAVSQETESGWWCDKALRRIPIDPALLRVGANEIALTCRYDENHSGLELVYLLGSFGVAVRGAEAVMTRAPKRLRVGDWVKQGLAFYAGHVTYEKTIRPRLRKGERLFVRAPEYRGIALRVLVNGRVAGLAPWEPNEVEITPFLNGGAVRLGIQVLGHRRNSHGPLHHRPKWPRWTGPDEFKSRGRKWADGYQLVPCGLMREPELVVKR
jgi:hypothetical protein